MFEELDQQIQTSFGDTLKENLATGVLVADVGFKIRFINKAASADWPGHVDSLASLGLSDDLLFKLTKLSDQNPTFEKDLFLVTARGRKRFLLQASFVNNQAFGRSYLLELTNLGALTDPEERWRELVGEDDLTGVSSRRAIIDSGQRMVTDCRRYKSPFAIGMMDLDGFKSVNDLCGHRAGDQMLVFIANVCMKNLRANDMVGRWGGDEFVFLFPYTKDIDAVAVAQRLIDAVNLALAEAPPARVLPTMSIGIAGAGLGGDSLENIIERADKALYKAKDLGGNRVVLSSLTQQ